jgi:hypothetical protein
VSFQFGNAPPKQLGERERSAIALLLQKSTGELADLFTALDTIITANSYESKPLIVTTRRDSAREVLQELREPADALQLAIGRLSKDDEQVLMRLILGSMRTGPNGEPPLGDFSKLLLRFRNILEDIGGALVPPKGGGAQADHLRFIAYLCAIQYRKATGKAPAKRANGVFHRMMNLVLAPIGLKLPAYSYGILRPAIDAAEGQQPPSVD